MDGLASPACESSVRGAIHGEHVWRSDQKGPECVAPGRRCGHFALIMSRLTRRSVRDARRQLSDIGRERGRATFVPVVQATEVRDRNDVAIGRRATGRETGESLLSDR